MADHCPNCGATVTGHYAVCVVCDAIVGDPASVPPVAAWVPPSSAARQARAKIILIALAVLAALAVAFGLARVSTTPSSQAATPGAPNQPASVSAEGLGVDIYPGACQRHRALRKTNSGSTVTTTLTTSDSFDKVADFYEARLGSPLSRTGHSAVFAASSAERKTGVMLTISAETAGQTTIGILHATTR